MKQFQLWERVLPQPFTVDGTSNGIVTVASTFGFYLGQKCIIKASSLPDKQVQIKKFLSRNELLVGPIDNNQNRYTALNFYTVALGATIEAVEQTFEQLSLNVNNDGDILNAVFEFWPIGALRTTLVDRIGDYYTSANPLPVTDVTSSSSSGPQNPVIVNLISPLANTEYSTTIPSGAKKFMIKSRDSTNKIQISYTAGQTPINFITIHTGCVYTEKVSLINPLNLYYRNSKPNQIIELIYWT